MARSKRISSISTSSNIVCSGERDEKFDDDDDNVNKNDKDKKNNNTSSMMDVDENDEDDHDNANTKPKTAWARMWDDVDRTNDNSKMPSSDASSLPLSR